MRKTLSFSPTLSFRGDRQVGTNQERYLVNIRYAILSYPPSNTAIAKSCLNKFKMFLKGVNKECLLTNAATDEESLDWIEVWNCKQRWESFL